MRLWGLRENISGRDEEPYASRVSARESGVSEKRMVTWSSWGTHVPSTSESAS